MADFGSAGRDMYFVTAQAAHMALNVALINACWSDENQRPVSCSPGHTEQDFMGNLRGGDVPRSFRRPLEEWPANEQEFGWQQPQPVEVVGLEDFWAMGEEGWEEAANLVDFWAPLEGRRARHDPVARRARRWARVDSPPPAWTEEWEALRPFMRELDTNAYNLREANNPRVRPDFWETERAHLARAPFDRETLFLPHRHLTEDRYQFGPSGVVTLANQMWVDMAGGREADSQYVAGAVGMVLLEFITNCVEYGDQDEVGTFYPQQTDNRLQHDKRRRHFHRRLFVRTLKYHGVNEARKIAKLSRKEIDQAWLYKMVDAKDHVDGKTFDELLRSKGPVEEWNEEESKFLEADPEDADDEGDITDRDLDSGYQTEEEGDDENAFEPELEDWLYNRRPGGHSFAS